MNCQLLVTELLKADNLRAEVVMMKDRKWVAVLGTEPTGKHKRAVTLRLAKDNAHPTSSEQVSDELLKTPDMELVMPDSSGEWIEVLGVTTFGGPRWDPATFSLTAEMGNGPGVIEYHEWEDDS